MAQVQIQTLKPRHVAIADWLIAHPDGTLGQCARELGYTQTWISIIVNSDAFKQFLARRQESYFDERIVPLRDKVVGVAHRAVERLAEHVEVSGDPNFLLATADKTLHRLGYAPTASQPPAPQGQVNIQNNYYTDKETLARARERMLNGTAQMSPAQELQSSGEDYLGRTIVDSSALPAPEEA